MFFCVLVYHDYLAHNYTQPIYRQSNGVRINKIKWHHRI